MEEGDIMKYEVTTDLHFDPKSPLIAVYYHGIVCEAITMDDLPPYIFDSKTKRLLDDKERSDVFFVSSNVHLNENSIDFLTIVPNGYPCFDGRITVSDLRTMTLRSLEEQFPIFPPIECSYDKLTGFYPITVKLDGFVSHRPEFFTILDDGSFQKEGCIIMGSNHQDHMIPYIFVRLVLFHSARNT